MNGAIITSIVSLIISLMTYAQFLFNQKQQREFFKSTQKRQITEKLIELRLANYPQAMALTELIQKRRGDNFDKSEIENILNELYKWRTGIVLLILSNESQRLFFDLRDALLKQPALIDKYSEIQVEKIWESRNNFRKSLRRDIGLLHREDENKN